MDTEQTARPVGLSELQVRIAAAAQTLIEELAPDLPGALGELADAFGKPIKLTLKAQPGSDEATLSLAIGTAAE